MRTMRIEDRAVRDVLTKKLAVDAVTAGKALDLSPESIRKAVKRGELPSAGVGRSVRIPTYALRERLGLDRPKAKGERDDWDDKKRGRAAAPVPSAHVGVS